MRILHLVSDEKFISFTEELFASIPGIDNSYLIIVQNSQKPLKYIKNTESKFIIDKHLIAEVSSEKHPHDAIIIHYLDTLKIRVINQLKTAAPILWSGWGGDYYEALNPLRKNIFGPQTIVLNKKIYSGNSLVHQLSDSIRSLKRYLIDEPRIVDFIKKVHFFSSPIPDDIKVITSAFPLQAEYLQINYGSVEKTFNAGPPMTSGRDILVGNSASASNNHLEIFSALQCIDLEDRRVIVPLSYGSEAYRDQIISAGQRMLGGNFIPLIEFMPLDAYNALISKCSTVIMGHRRQQAVGNIATMLYKGARIFLEQNTTTYQFLKSRGAAIFTLDDLANSRTDRSQFQPLPPELQAINARVVDDFWSHQRVTNNVQQLVTRIENHISSAIKNQSIPVR